MKQKIKSQLRAGREWLRLSEAAHQISETLGEEFDVTEILSLCVDKFLTLSINFATGTLVRPGKLVDFAGTKWVDKPDSNNKSYMMSTEVGDNEYINFTDEAYPIKGIFDLPMMGMERQFVSGMIDPKQGVVLPTQSILGAFVVDSIDRTNIFQIITVFNDHHTGYAVPFFLNRLTSLGEKVDGCFVPTQLPEYAELVIRRESLTQFTEQIMSQSFATNSYGNDTILRIERNNIFNTCIAKVANEFKEVNGYWPTTPDEILCRMINKPPIDYKVEVKNHQIIVNDSDPRDVTKVKRNINSFLKKAKLTSPY